MGAHRNCKKNKKCENYLSVGFGTDKYFSKGDVVYIEDGFYQDWFKVAGGSDSDEGKSVSGIVIGNDSSVYVTGYINTSPDNNPRDFDGNPVSGYGNEDIFVARLLSDGTQDWFKVAGPGDVEGGSLGVVVIGNDSSVYVTGCINISHGNNPRDFAGNLVSGYGSCDIFVARLLSDGTQDWFKYAGSSDSDAGSSVSGLVVGDHSSVYVTGYIDSAPGNNPKDFNGNPVFGYGGIDIFVAKLLSDGTQDWFKVAGGGGNCDMGNSVSGVVVGNDSSIYVTGSIEASPKDNARDFDGNPVSGYGDFDIFVSRLLSDGSQSWFRVARIFDDTPLVTGVVTGNDSSVYVTGYLTPGRSTDFNGNPISGDGAQSIFAARLLSDGTQSWFNVAGPGAADSSNAVVIGNDSSVYITGSLAIQGNPKDFEGNPVPHFGGGDIFVARLLSDGSQDWFKSAGGSGFDAGQSASGIVIENDSSVYITGFINTKSGNNPRDFDGNPISGDGEAIFVARMLSDGTQDWFKVAGSKLLDIGESVSGIVIENDSSVYVTGRIDTDPDSNPKDFNGNPVSGYGKGDIFIAKLGNKKIPVGIAKKDTCCRCKVKTRCCKVKTIISGKVPDCLVDNLEPCKTYYVTQDNPPILTTNVTSNKIGLTDNKGHLFLL